MMRVGESFCPGILHAVHAKDGLLSRIRVPGGIIVPSHLTVIAGLSSAFAEGQVEITSRSNLQLRAIQNKNLNDLVQGLDLAGLLPSPRHDRVRNIVASPFAGLGFRELLDSRPLVRELDRRLIADEQMAGLPPKFSFAIDGGGDWYSRDSDDLTLRAIAKDNTCCFHLAIGGTSSGFGVSPDRAVDCALAAAKLCLDISKKFDIPARGKKIASEPKAMDWLLHELSKFLVACPSPDDSGFAGDMPVGVYRADRAGLATLVPSVPLGRLSAEQTRCLAAVAEELNGDLRLAPWRGIVLGSIPESSIRHVAERLHAVGLSLDGKDGYRGIAACAGSTGCDASLADVRRDAALLARHLADRDATSGWTVNISGCEKQCAMRNRATVALIATPTGYDVRIDGHLLASNCSFQSVLETVVGRQSAMSLEVSS